jgi:hypothetical protein
MMGIVMPETCWALSVRQSNKFYDWLLHLVGCFEWFKMHGTTKLKVVLTVQFNSIFRAATTRKGRKPLQYILHRAIIVIVVLILSAS